MPDGNQQYDESAKVVPGYDRAVCMGCEQDWEGSAVDEVGQAHAARYDHEVTVTHSTTYRGPAEDA